MGEPVLSGRTARPPNEVEDIRSARPYFLAPTPLKTIARRVGSALALVTIDIAGLVLGLFAALAFRSLLFDPKPILWGLLWDHETNWLAFLILLLILVFWQAHLYAPREVREGAGRVVPSVFLVAALSLAFAIGTGQHFTTFGLYLVAATFVSLLIALFRASYELVTGMALRAAGVTRRAALVGDPELRQHLRDTLGSSRGGIDYEFVGEVAPGSEVEELLATAQLHELIVADSGLPDDRLLEIAEAAHRRGVKVRVAPRTTELLIERGEYVPGQGLPLFELRPPIFAGTQWAVKRVFDIVVALAIVIVGLPAVADHRPADQADVPWAGALSGCASRPRRAELPHAEVPHDGRRSGGPAERARRGQRGIGRALQDPRRSARHSGRAWAAPLLARRGAERAQRAPRRDVTRRAAAAAVARLRAARAVAQAPLQRAARA